MWLPLLVLLVFVSQILVVNDYPEAVHNICRHGHLFFKKKIDVMLSACFMPNMIDE